MLPRYWQVTAGPGKSTGRQNYGVRIISDFLKIFIHRGEVVAIVIQVLTNKAFCNDGNVLDTSVLVQYGNH